MQSKCWKQNLVLVVGLFLFPELNVQAEELVKVSSKSKPGLMGGIGSCFRDLFGNDPNSVEENHGACRRFRFRSIYILTPGAELFYPPSAAPVINYYTLPSTLAREPIFSSTMPYQSIGGELPGKPTPFPVMRKTEPHLSNQPSNLPPTEYSPVPVLPPKEELTRPDVGSSPAQERTMPRSIEGPKMPPVSQDLPAQLTSPIHPKDLSTKTNKSNSPIERIMSLPKGIRSRFKGLFE